MRIVLRKATALSKLNENKQNHIDTYQETVDGWEKKLEEYTVELNTWAKNGGKSEDRPKEPPKPKDYTEEYDGLIQKIEYHQLDTVEVEEYEFDQIINDKFNWSNGFLATNAMYSSR